MTVRIGVLGGGAWGTALALIAAAAGRKVTLWARDSGTVADINEHHENRRRLPGTALPANITATTDIGDALAADAVLLAVPAQKSREVTRAAAAALPDGTPVVLCAKGLEVGTGLRQSQVLAETMPGARPAVLSGPSFATDVAAGLPTAVTIAAGDLEPALDICRALAGRGFRPYAETDIVGVEIGGAVKNVLAIAAGIVTGLDLGTSARAATIARGFAELNRLAEALGARRETMMGLSGLGDLVLTCTSGQSRNFAFGERLGRDGAADRDRGDLVEGAWTAFAACKLAREAGLDMPIVDAVAAIVNGEASVEAAIDGLMARPLKPERG